MSNGQVINIGSTEAFDTLLSRAGSIPVFIDFTATWCGPCKVVGPVFDGIAKDHPKSVFLKIDVDDQKELAARYKITAMPTIIVLKDKQQVELIRGPNPRALPDQLKAHAA